jgi:single-stranded DNA-binding protein
MTARIRLPNRRGAIALEFEHADHRYRAHIRRAPAGDLAEVFVDADKPESALDALAADAAILISLLVQYTASSAEIGHALQRTPSGEPASLIGPVFDLLAVKGCDMSGIEVALLGTLSHDAELKTSKNGKAYLRLNVRCGDSGAAQRVSVMAFDPEAMEATDKMVRGARVHVEGAITLNEWTGQDGEKRAGLGVMSWHTRLAAIGRNKPKHDRSFSVGRATVGGQSQNQSAAAADNFHSDEIPF